MIFRYSAIDTAHRCLRRYQLQYVDKVQVDGAEGADLVFGTALHTALQATLEGDNGLLTFQRYWKSVEKQEMIHSRLNWDGLSQSGEVLLAKFERLHAKHFTDMHIEKTLRGNVGGYEFEGTPDIIGLYKGVHSVVDFKTSNRPYGKEKILLNEQMYIYAELARQTYGKLPEQLVYYVFNKPDQKIQVITTPLTEALLKPRLANVEMMCKDLIGRKAFPMNPNSCVMGTFKCPYYDRCHGGKNG
jgi:hypothetical protein